MFSTLPLHHSFAVIFQSTSSPKSLILTQVVTVSTFCNEGGIRVERGLDKLHTAVVKDVQWRDEYCLASCGDDRTIQISDVREKEGGRIGLIINSHDCTVHTIRWHPVNNHTFLSAGLDQDIKLWDLRNISVPSKVLSGHVSPYVRKIRSIRHPEFYAGKNGLSIFYTLLDFHEICTRFCIVLTLITC